MSKNILTIRTSGDCHQWNTLYFRIDSSLKIVSTFLAIKSEENSTHGQARSDTIYELGSGDGRILRACLPYHPHKIVGYEISWILILYSRLLNRLRKESIQYKRLDFFQQDFRDADVIFCFLLPQALHKIEQNIRPTLRPGTRFITNIFKLEHTDHHHKEGSLYVYIKTE